MILLQFNESYGPKWLKRLFCHAEHREASPESRNLQEMDTIGSFGILHFIQNDNGVKQSFRTFMGKDRFH